MRVLVLVASYPPILDSAARLYSQLAESLVNAGHSVTVITEHPADHLPVEREHSYFEHRQSDSILNGVHVRRVSPLSFMAQVPGGKATRFLLSCILFTGRGLLLGRHDVILVYSPPLFMGIAGYVLSLRHRIRFVLNVQDIHPKVLFDSGAVCNRWLKAILIKVEELCCREAHAFVVYSTGNRDYLLGRSVRGEVNVIPNWVDMTAVRLGCGPHRFREEEGIGDRLMITYAGTMQPAQGLEVVVAAAELLKAQRDIVFFLAGEGVAKGALQQMIEAKGLENVLLRPVMPGDRYVQCLHASDVCLVSLGAEIPLQTVPGKLAYTMACGKAILAVVNLRGDAASVVNEAGGGLCVSPGDLLGFVNAVMALYRDADSRREMGLKAAHYAERHFSREACTRQYEAVLLAASTA